MLELRPSCEHCEKKLPPASTVARICSFECTFCADCVANVLRNVCPNCGGGFCPRPIRPANNWKDNLYVDKRPPRATPHHNRVNEEVHRQFSMQLVNIPPEER